MRVKTDGPHRVQPLTCYSSIYVCERMAHKHVLMQPNAVRGTEYGVTGGVFEAQQHVLE